jgi:predicted RNA polymerase sigma factor
VIGDPTQRLDEGALRALVAPVLAGLVRRGEDFDSAEDALQEALLEALRVWPEHPPREPRAWLTVVATRRLVDARRSEAARQRREEAQQAEPRVGGPAPETGDDTLFLFFCCCHPDLAIRLARQLTLATEEPEARGLLALMLLNHARLPARLDSEGRIVTLDRQDRGLWDTREIAEGVRVLESALRMQTVQRPPGRYQLEAGVASLPFSP